MSPSTGSPAKRQKTAEKQSMKDVPADQFASMIEYYDGPKVVITVGAKQYKLPKRLVCHCSSFLDRAFNGKFKEGEKQEMTLDSTSAEAFELVIKWIYTGHLVLPAVVQAEADIISRLLDFIVLADFLDLSGPFATVTDALKEKLSKSRDSLDSKHIVKAMSLPSGHTARRIVVQACIGPYLVSLGGSYSGVVTSMSPFKFKKELNEVNGFAAEFFQLYDETRRMVDKKGRYVKDPLTGGIIYKV